MGVATFVGVAILVAAVLMNVWSSKKAEVLQAKQMVAKDKRIKLLSEILAHIKVLKMYAWEVPFMKSLAKIRTRELLMMKYNSYIWGLVVFSFSSAPVMMTLATFLTYCYATSTTDLLTTEKIFVSLSLFNKIRTPLLLITITVFNIIKVGVSFGRISEFFNAEEFDYERAKPGRTEDANNAIEIDSSSFAWEEAAGATLSGIDLKVKKGDLVAVVGLVGAGKSSLLSSILGEMVCLDQGVRLSSPKIAYVAQQAWIQNLTLRENILFGSCLEVERYRKVIAACGLIPDLKLLAAGENTEIGENGLNLSGGQKQRVAIARAVYNNADIYLLDDPLSALDAHVGHEVYRDVIGPGGLLDGKTRLLVTHNVSLLKSVDTILVMSGGRLAERGTYQELVDSQGSFSEFLAQYGNDQEEKEEWEKEEEEEEVKTQSHESIADNWQDELPEVDQLGRQEGIELMKQQDSLEEEMKLPAGQKAKTTASKKDRGRITEDEKMSTGSIHLSIYVKYVKAIGTTFFLLNAALYFTSEGLAAAANYGLTLWTREDDVVGMTGKFMALFGSLSAVQAFIDFFKVTTLFLACVKASRVMHEDLLNKVMHSPMLFFDSTPTGRIVNRFSSDIDVVDQTIPGQIHDMMACGMRVAFILLVISYSTPIFLTLLPGLLLLFYFIQVFYLKSSRQIRRLDMVSRSPVFSHFAETISGEEGLGMHSRNGNLQQTQNHWAQKLNVCSVPVRKHPTLAKQKVTHREFFLELNAFLLFKKQFWLGQGQFLIMYI